MSDDKLGNTSAGARGTGENGKEYYEDLYNDLPKEVVDILMQTHPLMGKDDNTEMRSRRRPAREDIEEVREARMQQVGSEINEIRRAPQQEGEPTRHVSRRTRAAGAYDEEGGEMGQKGERDDYDDGIQYVSVMPARKKSKIVEEVTLQTAAPGKRKKAKRDDNAFESFNSTGRNRYEEIDFEEKAKQEHLDSLYDDYEEEEYRGGSKLGIILGIIGLILIVFLIFRSVSLSSQLEEAKNQVTANADLSSRYEAIQLEKMQLEEELNRLRNPEAEGSDSNAGEGEGGTEGEGGAASGTNSGTNSGTTAGTTEYTVKEGDTAWSIAQEQLGNGAEYQKILDANNMKETDTISVGMKLKIPSA